MKKNKRMLLLSMIAMAIAFGLTMTSYAAGWQQTNAGWWWQNDGSTWPVSSWQWLDGNGDGVAECYYFDANGYMISNTTAPDGYLVDQDGHWTVNGVIQTKVIGISNGSGGGTGGLGGGAADSTTGAADSTTGAGNSPYADNRTVTGRYDLTSAGAALNDAYDTPIDKTDVTAINDPDRFCELMNQYCNPNEVRNPGTAWKVDNSRGVIESGISNIYFTAPGSDGDSRPYKDGYYAIIKTSKSRPIRGNQGDIYEVRMYGFEGGYLLVNTTRNGVYFNERGEGVVNGVVVKHTNYCYYGDDAWTTTLAARSELYWDEPLIYDGYPIFYHISYMKQGYGPYYTHGFGDCCEEALYNFSYD